MIHFLNYSKLSAPIGMLNILNFFDPPSVGIVLLRCLSAILFGASSLSPSEDCLQSSQTPSLKLQNE